MLNNFTNLPLYWNCTGRVVFNTPITTPQAGTRISALVSVNGGVICYQNYGKKFWMYLPAQAPQPITCEDPSNLQILSGTQTTWDGESVTTTVAVGDLHWLGNTQGT